MNDPNATHGVGKIIQTGKSERIEKLNGSVFKKVKTNITLMKLVEELGLVSYMGAPLKLRGKVIGAITFSSTRQSIIYTKEDLKFAEEVARRISLELDNIKLFQDAQDEIKERKQIENILIYLSEASKILSSSLDYKTTLTTVAKLGVPAIADWCTVEMANEKGGIDLLAIAHSNPKKVKWARKYRKRTPPDMSAKTGSVNVIRTGKSEFYPKITEEILKSAMKEEDIWIIRKMGGLSSAMIVPLIIKKKTVGAITYISSDANRLYAKADLAMAEEVANRAALAIENSRLYTDARRAIGIRDDFISIASHELRTPLTSLKMFTQVLDKKLTNKSTGEFDGYVRKMNLQIDKLTDLIKTLLDVSRVRTGNLTFSMSSFDLNRVVEDLIENIGQTSKRHNIELEGFIQKDVWGDKERISQVIINLLTNAIKYSPDTQKVVVRLSSEKDVAVVSVQDFGIGIDKEHQNKIFKRFYRVSEPAEKTYPGLGIGLYISYEIIKKHRGDMSVVSNKDKGSIFSFTIPYKNSKMKSAN